MQADGFIAGVNYRRGLRAEGPAEIFRFALPPLMALDFPMPAATTGQPFLLAGWATDRASPAGAGVDAMHVWAFPAGSGAPIFVGTAEYGRARPDVGSIDGSRFTNSGFGMEVTGLAPGGYTLIAYAHSTATHTFNQSRAAAVTVTVQTSQPAMNIDVPAAGAPAGRSLEIAGWAIDRTAPGGAGVDAIHVYAFDAAGSPTFLGAAAYGAPRTDVGAAYGAQFTDSGFSLSTSASLAPGDYALVVFARSVVSGSWFSQTRRITVRGPGDPLMTIDTPSSGASVGQPFVLAGWAVDRDATSGPGVDAIHVYAFDAGGSPTFFGVATYGAARPDVGAAYGAQFTNSGFSLATSASLAPGDYTLVAYQHSTVTGTFKQSRVVTVTIVP